MNNDQSHQQSENYHTDGGPSTEYKKNEEACRMDMEPRMSKRAVQFGGHSDSKQEYMDNDSE